MIIYDLVYTFILEAECFFFIYWMANAPCDVWPDGLQFSSHVKWHLGVSSRDARKVLQPGSHCTSCFSVHMEAFILQERERDYLANAGSSKCVCSAGQSQMFPIYAESCVQKWLLVSVSCWCLPKTFWGRQRALSLASSHTRASASFKIRAVIRDTFVKSPCKKSKCYSQTAFTESSATGAIRLLLCFYILSNPVSNITHHVSHCI